MADGTAWVLGSNAYRAPGDRATTDRLAPVWVGRFWGAQIPMVRRAGDPKRLSGCGGWEARSVPWLMGLRCPGPAGSGSGAQTAGHRRPAGRKHLHVLAVASAALERPPAGPMPSVIGAMVGPYIVPSDTT